MTLTAGTMSIRATALCATTTTAVRLGVRVLVQLSADVLLEDAGKHESGYRLWNIDGSNIVAPTASLASSNVKSDSFTLNATGSDSDSGVAKYEFYINDVKKHEVETSDGSVNWVVNADSYGSEITAETTYTCKVRVYDTAGNWKDSEEIEVKTKSAAVAIASAVNVGDFVNYDAGTWESSDESKITSSGGTCTWGTKPSKQGQFGGYTVGSSRNSNASGSYNFEPYGTPDYSGWRVWSIEGDVVTLISAGHPEVYYHKSGQSSASVSILTGRDCTMYVNSYATKAWILTGDEARIWYNTQFGTNYSSLSNWYMNEFSTASPVDVLDNNAYYWFASKYDSNSLYCVYPDAHWVFNYGDTYGIRANRGTCSRFSVI